MIRNLIACAAVLSFIFTIGTIGVGAQNVHPIAPTIEQLPSVVIGDGGDVAGSGQSALHLFRYTNVMNLATSHRIKWNNADLGFGNAQKHAYYISTPTGAIQASTDQRMVPELTYADIAAMQASGAKPSSAKEITDQGGDGGSPDFFWLSLANNMSATFAANMSSAFDSNAYNATADRNGRRLAEYGSLLDPAVVTLVLADGDFPTTAVAQADFTVYTIPGAEDGFSGAADRIYEASFNTGAEGWIWKAPPPFGLTMAFHEVTGGALTGRIGIDATKIYFGTWTTGDGIRPKTVIPASQALMEGSIYRATFTLTSTAANAENTPGYRILYMSDAFTHIGGLMHESVQSRVGSSIYAPSAGYPKDVMLSWAVPFALSEYSDTGKLATLVPGRDFRDYFLSFDVIGFEASDTGTIGLDNVIVDIIPRPGSGPNLANWGTGGLAFNSSIPNGGWAAGTDDAGTGLGKGAATVNANTITMTVVSADKIYDSQKMYGYQKIGPFANASGIPSWASNKLIRVRLDMASNSINSAPTFRVLTMSSRPDGSRLSLIWVDDFGARIAKGLYSPTGNLAAGAPLTGGSTLESYLYTHTAPTGTDAGVLDPQIDCFATGLAVYQPIGITWPAESGTLTLSKFQYEDCTH